MVASDSKILFVVAQINQANRAMETIRELGMENVDIAILYTKKNLSMPIMTKSSLDRNLFKNVYEIEIHPASNDISKIAARFNSNTYHQLLDTVKPSKLFLCSYERHYALLCKIASSKDISVNLFEEGTALYKSAVNGSMTFSEPTLRRSAQTVYNRVWRKEPIVQYLVYPLWVAIDQIARIPYLLGRTAWEIYKTPQIQKRMLGEEFGVILQGWDKFETIYATNTELAGRLFNADEVLEATIVYDNDEYIDAAKEAIERYGIDRNTAIFVSQRFDLPPKVQISAVINILDHYARTYGQRVLVKLHPREAKSLVDEYKSTIARVGSSDLISLIEGEHVPAEYLVVHSDVTVLLGISSTTLMYAPKAKQNLRAISISKVLRKALTQAGASSAGINMIAEHSAIIELLPYVEDYKFDPAT